MSAKATTTATTQGFKRCAAIAALAGFPRAATGLPVSERLCERVLSLPFHPYLDDATQDRIVACVLGALGR